MIKPLGVFGGEVRDPQGVKTAMQGCDIIVHLTALIAISFSYHSPDTQVDPNIKETLSILQARYRAALYYNIYPDRI